MNTDVFRDGRGDGRMVYVTYASPPILLLAFLDIRSTLRTGCVTSFFAYHIVYILAVGSYSHSLSKSHGTHEG